MSTKLKISLGVVVGALLAIVAGIILSSSGSKLGGTVILYPQQFANGLRAGLSNQLVISSTGAITTSGGITSTGNSALSGSLSVGEFTQGGGIITISTTSATYTLTEAQLLSGNVISIADVGTSAKTITLPATSTMTTLIPNAGDTREWAIQNLHTAAATTTTIAAGTGIDLQGITANDDVINGGVTGKLRCYRQASTDVVCVVNEYVVAD